MLRFEGYKVEEIAKLYGTRKEWISQVCRKYREQGLEEFIRNKYKTHHRALTDAEEDAILAPFEKAAEAGQVVTVKEIKAAFDKARGKEGQKRTHLHKDQFAFRREAYRGCYHR